VHKRRPPRGGGVSLTILGKESSEVLLFHLNFEVILSSNPLLIIQCGRLLLMTAIGGLRILDIHFYMSWMVFKNIRLRRPVRSCRQTKYLKLFEEYYSHIPSLYVDTLFCSLSQSLNIVLKLRNAISLVPYEVQFNYFIYML